MCQFDHDASDEVENGALVPLALGLELHPEGHWPECLILGVELLRGPYGPWFRFSYETPEGRVYALVSPRYTPESELGEIAYEVFGHYPESLTPADLVGRRVTCFVTRVIEHGAEVASASRQHAREETLCPRKIG